MPFATNHGVRISYDVAGHGPPLVLHHGFAQRAGDWHDAGYVDELAATHTVLLIDARGHGDSDKPHDKSAYIWPVQVFDVIAVLDELKVSRAAYWGYSMGGEFGFGLAAYAPHRISALLCGGASAHGSDMGTAFRGIDGTDPEAFLERLAARTGASEFDGDARSPVQKRPTRACCRSTGSTFPRAHARRRQHALLHICGRSGQGPHAGKEFCSPYSRGKVYRVPGSHAWRNLRSLGPRAAGRGSLPGTRVGKPIGALSCGASERAPAWSTS